jgi:hypothetical protein
MSAAQFLVTRGADHTFDGTFDPGLKTDFISEVIVQRIAVARERLETQRLTTSGWIAH